MSSNSEFAKSIQGWICARCMASNSPQVLTCACTKLVTKEDTNYGTGNVTYGAAEVAQLKRYDLSKSTCKHCGQPAYNHNDDKCNLFNEF